MKTLWVAVLACACAASPRAGERAARGPRYVVVRAGTSLRQRPDEGAPSVLVAAEALAFRRASARGAWVELETVADVEAHCASALAVPEGLRVRLWARGDALLPVVASAQRAEGPEGSLVLGAGLAVDEGSARAGALVLRGVTADTASSYARAERGGVEPTGDRLASGAQVALPEGVIATVERGGPVYVRARRRAAGGERVSVEGRCVRVEGTVPAAQVLPAMEVETAAEESAPGARWVLRRGAQVRWGDGSPAGRASRAVTLDDDGAADGDRRCFAVRVLPRGAHEPLRWTLCAATADLRAP